MNETAAVDVLVAYRVAASMVDITASSFHTPKPVSNVPKPVFLHQIFH